MPKKSAKIKKVPKIGILVFSTYICHKFLHLSQIIIAYEAHRYI